ncbi:hypothetical protein ACGFIR_24310 [Micromonospora sp. NPDC049051]|uniref:hypothetical protein n=1 Tax=unclassified Micromonospora TaxID=2617518 RepID=UPI003720E1D3
MDYRKLFADVHRRPGMFGLDGSFHDFTVFIRGCEAGNDWQLLAGFREWLVARCGSGDNLVWEALILWQAFRDGPPRREELQTDPELDRVAVETLFRLLDEFLRLRAEHDGLTRIFDEYLTWRKGQSWS